MLKCLPRHGKPQQIKAPTSKSSQVHVRRTIVKVQWLSEETFLSCFCALPEIIKDIRGPVHGGF